MRKIVLSLTVFSIILGTLFVAEYFNKPTPSVIDKPLPIKPAPELTFQDALSSVSQSEISTIISWLCSTDLEGRMSGKKGNDKACDYLVDYFTKLGYETSLQEFAIQNLNNHKELGSGKTANVIAMLPGNDPVLKNETVVIGAHFDHIGYGPSMSQTPQIRAIHPGADDNASGTTALMGAAKVLSKMKGKNKRRIVVITFSAEEMGLIGSRFYVNNPKYPNTVFMLNMDMVGRLRGKSTIDALGAGSSPEVKKVIESIQGYPFRANITGGSGGGSDHAPFYQKGIPICFLHTGMHGDYHTPEDTVAKIDLVGLTWVAKYSAHITWEMNNLAIKPSFSGVVNTKELEFFDHDFKK